MLIGFLIAVLLGAVACLWNRGLWTSALSFVNVVFAALLAMNFFEPLAAVFDSEGKSNMWTFLCLWGLFAIFFTILRLATDLVSQVRVRFPYGLDVAGAVLFALWTGWIMFCFTLVSLHVAPLPRTAFIGAFMAQPDEKMMGVGPDRLWLAFTRQVSLGAFSNSDTGFDPEGDFAHRYAARRQAANRPGG